jgi:hypothetical protein
VTSVVAAYAFVAAVFGAWVGIMARRTSRRAREMARLDEQR